MLQIESQISHTVVTTIGSSARYIRLWLWLGAGLVFMTVIVGGITRLADSGLSMSDWNLIMGTLPPMNESEWIAEFEQYKQFPQYQQLNVGMTLGEFKEIFFWEYLHRLLGRVIGVVFLVPFLFFWIAGHLTPKWLKRILLLFGLGTLQAIMGWFMVKSGLVDLPYVSHYRLALHLLLAFVVISFCIWYALDLQQKEIKADPRNVTGLKRWLEIVGFVFVLQVTWGAFTAGLDAGLIYNTFPLMNGQWLPQKAWTFQPLLVNFVENPGTVQWIHRVLGTVLAGLVIWHWIRTRDKQLSHSLKLKSILLLVIILVQYGIGIVTLLFHVPIALGVLHQAGAMIFWAAWLSYYHDLKSIA